MASTIKVDNIQDSGGNSYLSSDGAGTFTTSNLGIDNSPFIQVYLSSNQTLTNGQFDKLTFDSETYDTGSNFASNKFTVVTAGYYYIELKVDFDYSGEVPNDKKCKIQKNGSDAVDAMEFSQRVTTNDVLSISTNRVFDMNGTTDYLETYVYQINYNGGATRNLRPLASQRKFCTFGGHRIGS